MKDIDIQAVKVHAMRQFSLGPHSVHGPDHWTRVHRNAMVIARKTGADPEVITLFAYLHDACRWDDGSDLAHGKRAAKLVESMQGSFFTLADPKLELLAEACRRHTTGRFSDDPTIGTCWDADRLDIGRVGIIPSPRYMSTVPGKEIARLGSLALYDEKTED